MGATGITGTEPQPFNFLTQQVSVLLVRPAVRVRARRQYTGSHVQIVNIYNSMSMPMSLGAVQRRPVRVGASRMAPCGFCVRLLQGFYVWCLHRAKFPLVHRMLTPPTALPPAVLTGAGTTDPHRVGPRTNGRGRAP